MLFFVKTLTGKKFILESEDFKTILDVKIFLNEYEGMDHTQIRLITDGKSLNDTQFLEDILNEPEKILYMIIALRGG